MACGVASIGDGNVAPASLASLAARSLERMPPVPSLPWPLQTASIGSGQLAHRAQQARTFAIGKIEAIHIGEQKQPVRFDRGGQQGAQFIVVAECPHQFAHRNAVILVHYRDHAELQQFMQSILQVAVTEGRGEVIA